MICSFSVVLLDRTKLDDTLDVFACHGMGGIFGAIATGFFAQKLINPAGADGLFYGNPKQVLIQIAAVAATAVWGFVMSVVLLKIIDKVMGLRVTLKKRKWDWIFHNTAKPLIAPIEKTVGASHRFPAAAIGRILLLETGAITPENQSPCKSNTVALNS